MRLSSEIHLIYLNEFFRWVHIPNFDVMFEYNRQTHKYGLIYSKFLFGKASCISQILFLELFGMHPVK